MNQNGDPRRPEEKRGGIKNCPIGAPRRPKDVPKLQTKCPKRPEEKRGGTQMNQNCAPGRPEEKRGDTKIADKVPKAPRGEARRHSNESKS